MRRFLTGGIKAILAIAVLSTAAHWAMRVQREPATPALPVAALADPVTTGSIASRKAERAEAAHAAGVREVILDPGIGFAKSAEDNWALLGGMDRLTSQGYPLLIGASRKRFLAALNPNTVDEATAAVSTLAAAGGAWAVRVHKVAPSRAAVDVAAQWTAHRRRAHG